MSMCSSVVVISLTLERLNLLHMHIMLKISQVVENDESLLIHTATGNGSANYTLSENSVYFGLYR